MVSIYYTDPQVGHEKQNNYTYTLTQAGSDSDTDGDPPPKSSFSKQASTTNKQSGSTGDLDNKRNPKNGDDANDCDMYDAGKASECKEQGNVHFKQGEFALAVECYSDAISFSDPTAEPGSADGKQLAIYYANRAACYLSLNELEAAVHDCTDAIDYDPEYTRAWQRRCTASERRGKYSEALEDCKKLLELTPEKGVDGRTRTAEYFLLTVRLHEHVRPAPVIVFRINSPLGWS